METMRDIRNRMKSVRQTRQVTGAMKLISTSKLRKARRRLEDTLPYFDGISEAMRDIIGHSEESGQKWFDRREGKAERKVATLVITADKGLAGGSITRSSASSRNPAPQARCSCRSATWASAISSKRTTCS